MTSIKTLERKRFSILTDDLSHCYICGKSKNHIHEIYEGARRIASMKYGCCIPVCNMCHVKLHSDYNFALLYKQLCQKKFEELYSKNKFIEIFKRSYL